MGTFIRFCNEDIKKLIESNRSSEGKISRKKKKGEEEGGIKKGNILKVGLLRSSIQERSTKNEMGKKKKNRGA